MLPTVSVFKIHEEAPLQKHRSSPRNLEDVRYLGDDNRPSLYYPNLSCTRVICRTSGFVVKVGVNPGQEVCCYTENSKRRLIICTHIHVYG